MTSRVYVLENETETLTFSRIESIGVFVKSALEVPQVNKIHTGFCSSTVNPVPYEIKVEDLDGKTLNLRDIAVNDPVALYSIQLAGPKSDQVEELVPRLEDRGEGPVLVVSGGTTIIEPGNYRLIVTANSRAFKDGFAPANTDPVVVEFVRQDPWLNQPKTCQQAQITGSILGVMAVGALVILFTGGPGGLLEITRAGSAGEVEAAFRLSKARIRSRVKNRQLDGLGIDSIQYQKAPNNSIQLSVKEFISKQEILNTILEKMNHKQ